MSTVPRRIWPTSCGGISPTKNKVARPYTLATSCCTQGKRLRLQLARRARRKLGARRLLARCAAPRVRESAGWSTDHWLPRQRHALEAMMLTSRDAIYLGRAGREPVGHDHHIARTVVEDSSR